jgi:hypothetical protein
MDKEGWCRPKVWRQYIFGDRCWISCLPQQKWQFKREEGEGVTIFSEKWLINFKITEEDFKARWLEIEVKGKYDKFATERLSHD